MRDTNRSLRSMGLATLVMLSYGGTPSGVVAAEDGLLLRRAVAPTVKSIVNQRLGLAASTVVHLDLPGALPERFQTVVPFGDTMMTLDLAAVSVRAANYTLLAEVADGSVVEVDPGPSRTYRGTVSGIRGSVVAASLLNDGLVARILLPDGGEYWVEPIASRVRGGLRGQHAVYRKSDVIEPDGECGNDTKAIRVGGPMGSPDAEDVARSGGFGTAAATTNSVAELANDADFEYFQDHGSNPAQVAADIAAVTNAMNIQYERDTAITHMITTTIVRTVEPDPYTATDNVGLINQFRNEWNTNQTGIQRDVAQLFTGKDIGGSVIGRAFSLGNVCNLSDAYCFVQSDFNNNFSCATDLSAHELGHCWNAFHCSCGFPNSFTMNSSITCANRFRPVDSIPTIVGWRSVETCDTGGDPPPANDLCSNAQVTCTGTLNGTTDSAGNDVIGSCIGAATGAPDVWYSYTPNANGILTVNTCGTVYDTTLSIYDACVGNELVCNDDSGSCGGQSRQSSVSLSVSAGVTYLIRVSGWRKQAGDFTLSISGPECGGCTSDPECDDLNECTTDVCNAGTCENTPVADNTSCSGGAGVCCGGTCTTPTCSSNADCDDSDLCTTDTCNNPGTCSASCSNDPVQCPPSESCNPANGNCEPQVCNNNNNCEPGEDCNNCSNDCRSKTNGNPNRRYCCDGDLPQCGDPRCSEGGFSCACTGNPDCDDGDPCNGAETCVGGSCQGGTPPPCQNGDGCCPSGCTPTNDDDCDSCVNPGGLPPGASCASDAECCSDKCKGRSGAKTCK